VSNAAANRKRPATRGSHTLEKKLRKRAKKLDPAPSTPNSDIQTPTLNPQTSTINPLSSIINPETPIIDPHSQHSNSNPEL
jgi:hypothetical protein